MNRLTFLKKASLISTLPFISSSDSLSNFGDYKIGLQLFSVRDAMEKDPISTLKSLKEMGYEDFESYGYDTERKKYYGFSPIEFKSILNDLGLTTSSGHYGVNALMESSDYELFKYLDSCINASLKLGDKYIIYPMLETKYQSNDGYKLLVKKLNLMGEKITKSGLNFAYHNFGYDFNLYDRKMGIEWVIEETNPDWVKLQVDFYWVIRANKIIPKDLINLAIGRFKLWHIKDMDPITKDYTELGFGSIDYSKVLPNPNLSGLEYYYLEQGGNYKINSMDSAKKSIAFFKKNIQELI
tara:strand:- start:122 stop:1012 length:891 start_codon:yes stop_codon:yes gene_type:complete